MDPRHQTESHVRADGQLDKSQLERELGAAFGLEHKRKAEDDMKKRAILTARSYDEFKNLVSVATLKSLDKGDLDMRCEVAANKALRAGAGSAGQEGGVFGGAAGGGVARDAVGFGLLPPPAAGGTQHSPQAAAASAAGVAHAPALGGSARPPRTAAEVERTWRKLPATPPAARYAFLAATGAARLGDCFRAELDGEMLGEVAAALAAQLRVGAPCDALFCAQVLLTLARNGGGFALALSMMGGGGAGAVARRADVAHVAAAAAAAATAAESGAGKALAVELRSAYGLS